MIHFVGAGPGAPDLITLRGANLLKNADVIVYTGSLVNPELLQYARPETEVYNSAHMTLEQVMEVLRTAYQTGKEVVRLHTGDPCLYGAVREQMDLLDAENIPYDNTPGVSSFSAAAAALHTEYTLPGVSQSLIITRMAGRTPVPEKEALASLAAHHSSMVIFLSASLLKEVQEELLKNAAYAPDTPAAIVYKVSWPEEKVFSCTVGTLASCGAQNGIHSTALILVGEFLQTSGERSRLYDPSFSTGFRETQE